jgi:hypothetical protein
MRSDWGFLYIKRKLSPSVCRGGHSPPKAACDNEPGITGMAGLLLSAM